MCQSPYEQHRDILLDGKYSTAYFLQDFVLHQYDSAQYPFDASRYLGGFDSRHLQIYKDLKQFYWDNGPSKEHGDISLTIIAKRTAEAQANFDELTVLRATNPAGYPTEAGGSPAVSHRYALEVCELHHKRYSEMGFPITSPSPGIQV